MQYNAVQMEINAVNVGSYLQPFSVDHNQSNGVQMKSIQGLYSCMIHWGAMEVENASTYIPVHLAAHSRSLLCFAASSKCPLSIEE